MAEVKIAAHELLTQSAGDGGSCSEAEPFALQCTDDSMEPEFDAGCIIIIDPSTVVRDGSYVFAKDLKDEYIFRRLRIVEGDYFLEPLNPAYDTFRISGMDQIEGVITQRAGKRRSYHKWYDK
uniref:Peptidase n=1 Tax=uncultured Thiotrichaceae bacterium TaxID=298394 RepID=A0A6S6U3F2_9GAMM|nr:MAG: Peptidase [uncultured Thiotrichaceae bacterium]